MIRIETEVERQAAILVNRMFLLALAWKDSTPGGLQKALSMRYQSVVKDLNTEKPPKTDLANAVTVAYNQLLGQLPKP